MDALRRDLAYALRSLTRNRTFAAAAVVTIALGIGANTAIFSVVHGVLLRPLPYPDADRIHLLWNNNALEGIERDVTSYPNFTDWRTRSDVFAAMAGFNVGRVSITSDGDPEEVSAAYVTADFLDVLGVQPAIGRGFSAEELQPGGDAVLLSDGLWQTRFGGRRDIIGRTIALDGVPVTVVGVMPADFQQPEGARLWRPLAPTGDLAEARSALWLSVIGRLRADVDPALAQRRMSAVASQLAEEYPGSNAGAGILLEPLHTAIVGDVRTPLLVLLGAVGAVLLIACANVASLLLARGAVRRKELAIRSAMGAGRGRIALQLLTENCVLALAGGALGAILAVWVVGAIVAAAPPELPRVDAIEVNAIVLTFAVIISLATGLLFGLAPLAQAGRADITGTLRDGGRDAMGTEAVGRLRPALVIGEVSLALVLLIAAGLLIRSFMALSSVDIGFATRNALTFRVAAPASRYATGDEVRSFYADLLQRVEAVPGVQAAGGIGTLFLSRLPNMGPITLEGDAPLAPDAPRESVVIAPTTTGLFDALGLQILQGRGLTMSDGAGTPPIAVVNEAFVRRFLPNTDPLARRFVFGDGGEDPAWIQIVGVVSDARRSGLAQPPRPEAFVPHQQATSRALTIVARTAQDPLAALAGVRGAVRDIDPLLPIAEVATLEQSLAESLATRRFIMVLLIAFAALAAALATIGIYSVVSYLVAQRTREFGIRMALGATRRDVQHMIIGQSLRQIVPGVAIGAAAALAFTRLMGSQLFGVRPHDPLTFLAVSVALIGVGCVASYVPARRAGRLDPNRSIREE